MQRSGVRSPRRPPAHPFQQNTMSKEAIDRKVEKKKIEQQLENMRRDWDARARENARYYVATGRADWTDEDFFASGEKAVAEEILTDMINICQGKEPKQMRVLEIG